MYDTKYQELTKQLKDSPYAKERKSTGKQLLETLVPIAALAAGAYALHKGVKWGAKGLAMSNHSEWKATRDMLHKLHGEGKGSVIHQIMERLK